jgi:hypothetical protein
MISLSDKRLLLGFIASTFFVAGAPVMADQPTTESVTRALTKANVLTRSFQVQCNGSHCNVVTYRNPRATENDIKIDSILVAKAIRDVYPAIESVTVQFYEASNLRKYQFIEVHAGDVTAFGQGGLSKDQLLRSLPVHVSAAGGGSRASAINRQVVDNYQVAPGFNKSGRTRMLADLQDIQAKGGDLSELWPRFMAIEKVIREGGAESITNDFNMLVPDVGAALQNAQTESNRIAESARLRNNQLESQAKVGQIVQNLHSGYGYMRRARIAREIDRKLQMGENVQYFQSTLWNVIEPLCRNRDGTRADEQMAQLERMMGLSPYMGK